MGNPKARTGVTVRRTYAFAASKRTAKIEKRSRIGIEAPLDLLGGKLQRFKPRFARIWNLRECPPLWGGCREAAGEVLIAKRKKLTRGDFEKLSDLLGKNSLQFKPRSARIYER